MMLEAVEARFSALCAPQPIQRLSDNGLPYIAGDTRSFRGNWDWYRLPHRFKVRSPTAWPRAFVNALKRDYASVSHLPDAKTILAQLPG